MISFLKFILESKQEKHAVVSFVRMNPPHEGHGEVIHSGQEEAKRVGGEHHLIVSHSHDSEKNPLTAEQKVKHVKRGWPGVNVTASSPEHPSLLHHLAKLHKAGVRHVTIVGGSDRDAMGEIAKKYNGVKGKHGHYKFKSMNFVQAGAERSDAAKGKASYSASKMREAVKKGDRDTFKKMAPSGMKDEHKDEMFNDVEAGMKKK
jgi:hypothetical protein